jgi:arylsulfatase A-like enzyme
MVGLFVVELFAANLEYMGVSDAKATDYLIGRYARVVALQQLGILFTYVLVGVVFGAIGAELARAWDWANLRARRRWRGVAVGLLTVAVAHGYLLARSIVKYPQLYADAIYDRGGARRGVMVFLTDYFSPLALDLLAVMVLLGAAALPFAVRGSRARLLEALRSRPGRRWSAAVVVGTMVVCVAAALVMTRGRARVVVNPKKPNVLVIAVDSLRADRVFWPDAPKRFPTLAGLAQRGVRLRDAHVTVARTFPSFVTMLTGRWPHHHGIRHMFPSAAARAAIGPALPTALHEAGYHTAILSDYAGEIFSRTPLGFDEVDVPRFDMTTVLSLRGLQLHAHALPYATSALGRRFFHSVDAMPEHSDPAILAARARDALDRLGGEPFFLTLFFSAAHFPYAAPAPYYRRFSARGYHGAFRYQKPPLARIETDEDAAQVRALYDGAVASVDEALGSVLRHLERRGLDKNTIVVLLADHGENLYDDPARGMGHGDHLLGPAADHVPVVIYDPVHGTVARDIDAITRDVDLAPTLAALTGIKAPPTDGVDLGPLLRGEKPSLELDAFGETEFWFTGEGPGFGPDERLPYPGVLGATELADDDDIFLKPEWEDMLVVAKHRAVTTSRWKLAYRPTRAGAALRLFDRRADADERRDVSGKHPEVVAELRKKLEAWMSADPGTSMRAGFAVREPRAPSTVVQPAPEPAAKPSLAGDARVYRFVDHARDAELTAPPLDAAWRAISYPAKTISPYSGLSGDAALRVVTLTLAVADVAAYGSERAAASKPVRIDPVWNSTRAVYEAKSALFAPTPARYVFEVPEVKGPLRLSIATPPGSPEVTFVVEADGKRVASHTIAAKDSGQWIDWSLPLAGAKRLALVTESETASAPAVWGQPALIQSGGGAPGLNVLLVVIDTLRKDAMAVMPRLSALAAKGVSFEHAITAATWTRPAILALLGGDLPTAIGQSAEEMIPPDSERRRFYTVSPPLLPRVLEARGYLSTAIGNNFFLLGHPQIGLDLGFDEVADIRHPVLDTPAITRAAIKFLDEHARESFFLHLHYDAPHWPYTAPPEYLKTITGVPGFPEDSMANAYLAEAAYADDYLGRVLDALEAHKLAERTLIVVAGDHGEIFDHAHSHEVTVMGHPTLHHHGWAAYDELLRVPLVMALPGTIAPRKVDAQVSTIDVEPTVRELVGLPPRSAARGKSLRGLMNGVSEPERATLTEGQNVRALRAGGWLYLRRSDGRLVLEGGKKVVRLEELYDLIKDPEQHVDLAGSRPDMLAKLRAQFDKEAPVARDAPVSVLHLRAALRSPEGRISVRHVAGAEAAPLDGHTLKITLRGAAQIDLVVDPPTAAIELSLRRDGTPLTSSEILMGPYALPLAGDLPSVTLEGDRLTWLDAGRAPHAGERGELTLWRDPNGLQPLITPAHKSRGDVADMMRRWGYAQPGK